MSQSCRPHLFFCAHLILQNSDFHFFFLKLLLFFFHFYYEKRRKFAVLEEFKHVGAQKTCKILFDFWKYGSWNFSVIFGFGCAWRQRPIEVKKKIKIKNKKTHATSVWKILASFETKYFFFFSLTGIFGDKNVERKRCTYDVTLTSLTGACPISPIEPHQIDIIRTAFTSYSSVTKGL